MKKIFLVLFLVTTLISLGEEAKGIFYKATKGDKSIYLFGDYGVPITEWLTIPEYVQTEYDKSKNVVNNLNPKESISLDKEEEAKMFEKLLYFQGSIEDDISKETIELLKIRFEEIGAEYSPMYKLGMQFMLLSMGQLQIIYNGIPTLSAFNTENKNVHYVTDSKKMIDYLLSIGSREIEFIVKVSLAEMIKNDEIQKNAWKNGDEKALYDNLMSYYSEYDFEVIGYFNDLYMEVINREIQNTNRLFVISRVEQLILRNSLINRLKKEGYKIERINK